jgi:Rrf2 family iron-sulfur cluster assembly transcriptional regulator
MRLSTRSRYAVKALTEIAKREDQGSVTVAEIGAAQMLSVAYLEQLLGRLRRAGLVRSARGPGGGYRLARPAAAITVAEVVDAVDDSIGNPTSESSEVGPDQRDLWRELGEQVRLFLAAITIADVVEGRTLGRAVPVPGASSGPGEAAE